MLSRRNFLKIAGVAGAGALMFRPRMWAFNQTPLNLAKFGPGQALPGLGPTGVPVASPQTRTFNGVTVDYYEIEAGLFSQQFHPSLPNAGRAYGYADTLNGPTNHRYLGGLIVAKQNTPVLMKVTCALPAEHILPVDHSFMDVGPTGEPVENRISVHLHGGFVDWTSDGGPHAWFDSAGSSGYSFLNGRNPLDGTVLPAGQAMYYYPNQQSARLMWYHDHAMDITRVNAYAGLATGYLIQDDYELSLINSQILPDAAHQIPLIIQDKSFVSQAAIDAGYPGNGGAAQIGDLWYPWIYEPNAYASAAPYGLLPGSGRWDYGPAVPPPAAVLQPGFGTLPPESCVPEFFADTALINGMAFPYAELEQRDRKSVV